MVGQTDKKTEQVTKVEGRNCSFYILKIGPRKGCLKIQVLQLFSTSEVLEVWKNSEKSNKSIRISFTKAGNGRRRD